MAFDHLRIEHDGRVAVVTIDRQKSLNALNRQAVDELRRAALELKADESVRSLIITGAGERAFVAGADIGELATLDAVGGQAFARAGQHVFDLLENLGKPVIAAVNGLALGGGCELAMACTLRVAADTARFGQPEIKLGLIPGYAGTQRLARLVGKGRALEILLTGRQVDAEEALRIGLVTRVVPRASLDQDARDLARTLAANPAAATRAILDAVHQGADLPLREGQFLEATLFGLVTSTEDMREGTRAFLEKRAPSFK